MSLRSAIGANHYLSIDKKVTRKGYDYVGIFRASLPQL